MTSINPSQSDHMLMCKQWWRVCWMYGDQEKFYRQLYGKKNTSRAIVTSTSTTTTNSSSNYEEKNDGDTTNETNEFDKKKITSNYDGDGDSRAKSQTLPRQGAYRDMYGLGATLPSSSINSLESRGKLNKDKKIMLNQRGLPDFSIPTISSSVPSNNLFHSPLLLSGGTVGKSVKPKLFPFPKELCNGNNNMSVLTVSPETLREQDIILRQKMSNKKKGRSGGGEKISTTETTTTTVTTMVTFERQIFTSNS